MIYSRRGLFASLALNTPPAGTFQTAMSMIRLTNQKEERKQYYLMDQFRKLFWISNDFGCYPDEAYSHSLTCDASF